MRMERGLKSKFGDMSGDSRVGELESRILLPIGDIK